MEAKGLFNVARKEFIDHLTSKRFILILVLFLIISAYSMHEGIGDYNNRLDEYKEQISRTEEIEGTHVIPTMPSTMCIFQRMREPMSFLGAILAIAMGFDLITREKETRSLKSLLSHPVYRDEIINGKALSGISALAFAVSIVFILLFAILLIFSIVPNMDEFLRIALFGAVTVLLLLTYFSIALMASTISKNSGIALMFAFVILLAISFGAPMLGGMAAKHMVGEPPERPGLQRPEVIDYEHPDEEREEWLRYQEVRDAYWKKRRAIRDAFEISSPLGSYGKLTGWLIEPRFIEVHSSSGKLLSTIPAETTNFKELLEKFWKHILVLLIFPVVFLAIAYVKFMRLDIR